MNECETCKNFDQCNYKSVKANLESNINDGIQSTNAPFSCNIVCDNYKSLDDSNMLVLPSLKHIKKSNNIFLKHAISNLIIRHALDDENIDTLNILGIYKDKQYNQYLVIAYMQPLIKFKSQKELYDHLYMTVYVIRADWDCTIYGSDSFRINLTQPKYQDEILQGCARYKQLTVLSNRYVNILTYLLNYDYQEIYKTLIVLANNYIRLWYSTLSVSTLSSKDMPDYLELIKQ